MEVGLAMSLCSPIGKDCLVVYLQEGIHDDFDDVNELIEYIKTGKGNRKFGGDWPDGKQNENISWN